jgi:hypothetical protein
MKKLEELLVLNTDRELQRDSGIVSARIKDMEVSAILSHGLLCNEVC